MEKISRHNISETRKFELSEGINHSTLGQFAQKTGKQTIKNTSYFVNFTLDTGF